jgi:hypothetical protein
MRYFTRKSRYFQTPPKFSFLPQFPHVPHVEGVPWRGYGNAEAYVEWNGMDMDPHYGSICGFRGMDLNPARHICLEGVPSNISVFRIT